MFEDIYEEDDRYYSYENEEDFIANMDNNFLLNHCQEHPINCSCKYCNELKYREIKRARINKEKKNG